MPSYGNLGEIERNQLRTRTGKLDSTFRGDDRRKKMFLSRVGREWGQPPTESSQISKNERRSKVVLDVIRWERYLKSFSNEYLQ